MMERRLTQNGRTRRFVVEHGAREGWVVREELDREVLDRTKYVDWHRVERAVRMKISLLERDGWNIQP